MTKTNARELLNQIKRGNFGWDHFYIKCQLNTILCNGLTSPDLYSRPWVAFRGQADDAKQVYDIAMATGDYKQCIVYACDEKTQLYPVPPIPDNNIPF